MKKSLYRIFAVLLLLACIFGFSSLSVNNAVWTMAATENLNIAPSEPFAGAQPTAGKEAARMLLTEAGGGGVEDTGAPVITLIGPAQITLTVGEVFVDPGVTVTDDVYGGLTGQVVVGGDTVDTNTAGTYVITYDVSDPAGNAAARVTRTVVVEEAAVATVISIEPSTKEVNVDDEFTVEIKVAPGVPVLSIQADVRYDRAVLQTKTAWVVEGDLFKETGVNTTFSKSVKDTQGLIDNIICMRMPPAPISREGILARLTFKAKAAGTTDITFENVTVSDATAQPATCETIKGRVTVTSDTDTTAPVLILNGPAEMTLTLGESFTDPGATASDNVDGDLTAQIEVGGDNVDTNTAGTYVITYDVSDAAGNAAVQATRTVRVVESVPVTGDDWEQFQNDLYNSGVTTSPAPVSPVEVGWKVQVGHTDPAQMAAGVNNTPLVVDGKVLVMGALADTWLLDAKTGDTVWTKQLSRLKQSFQLATPVYGDGIYFVATNDGHVYALAAGDGAEIWQKDLFQYAVDAGLSTCSINTLRNNAQLDSPLKYDNGKIYLGVWGTSQTDLNYYFCLNAETGEVLWERKTTSGNLGYYWSGPCVIGDYLLYGDQNRYITCVNKATGATVSEIKLTDLDPNGYWVRCSVSYSPETGCVYFGDEHGYLWAFDFNSATGQLAHRWHKKLGILINSTPAVYNGRLYVGTNLYTKLGDLFCLNASTGEEIWKFTPEMKKGDDSSGYYSEPGIQASPTIYVKDGKPYIYSTTICAYSTVYCLDEDGQKVWEFENEEAGLSGGYTTCSIAVSDGWVYFGNDGGYVYGLNAPAGEAEDTTAPVITLNGAAEITLTKGESFTDPGATALDDVDGDITDRILVSGDTVDTSTAGTYVITYNVRDAAGNAAVQASRTVIVVKGGNSGGNPGEDKITVYLSIEDMYGKQRFSRQVEVNAGATVLDVMKAAEKLDPNINMVYDPDNSYITGGYISSMYGQDSPWGERSDGWIYYVGGDYRTGTMPDRGVGYWKITDGEKIYWYWGTMDGRQPLSGGETTGGGGSTINQDETLEKIKEAKAKGLQQIEEIIAESITLPQEVIKELLKEKIGVKIRLENGEAGLIVPTEALSGNNELKISIKALKGQEAESFLKSISDAGKALTDIYDFNISGANAKKITMEQGPVILLSFKGMEVEENAVLAVYCYNEETGQWEKVANIEVDRENKEVKAFPPHLSKFVLMQMNQEALPVNPEALPVNPEATPGFSDVGKDHWAKSDIDFMVNKKIITGYPDGTFKPDQPVTRAEFTLLLVRMLAIPEAKEQCAFRDIQLNDWYNGAIAAAYQKGLVNGYDTGCFYPDNPVTREEAAVLLINALKYRGEISEQSPAVAELEKFNDKEKISTWACNAVAQALQENIVHGFPDGAFKPLESTTRAQAVTMLRKLCNE